MNCASRIYLKFLYNSFVVGTIFTYIYFIDINYYEEILLLHFR